MKLLEIIKGNPKQINEGTFSALMNKSFGNGFKAVVAQGIETTLNKVVDDMARSTGKVTMRAIKNSPDYINALKKSIGEASMAKYGKNFADLTSSEADVLAKNVQDGLDAHLLDHSKKTGKLADADLAAARQAVDQTSDAVKAGTATQADLRAATKNLQVNQKMATRVENMKKVLGGFDQRTRTQIVNLLKKDVKPIVGTGQEISTKVAGETTIFSGGKLFKLTKDQLKAFPGQVKLVIVKRPVLSTLVAMGLTAAVLYLIFGDGTIVTDESGKPIDDSTNINDWAPCIRDLIRSGEGRITTAPSGQVFVIVRNEEYPGSIAFYGNGRVYDVANSKMGNWKCKQGQMTIAEQNDSIPGPELMPFAYQYVRDNQTKVPEAPKQSQGGTKIGLKNIEITWDKPADTPPPPPRRSNYHDCSNKDFPYEFGCIAPKIAEIQVCLNVTPQRGYFGPKTLAALKKKGFIDSSNTITKETYDKVAAICNKVPEDSTDNPNVVSPAPEETPQPQMPTSGENPDAASLNNPVSVEPERTPAPSTPEESGEDIYNRLERQGFFRGRKIKENNRVPYKGGVLSSKDVQKLDQFFGDNGYKRFKPAETEKRYGEKYVWWKQ